ncbi:MAG TPA: molybdopterin-dependent oxidoreductase, partial [Dehalococcoidia bacterium]|nr:molybdopterin-dependent oxidoreductase [Dehalococcoidia bacterium]
MPKLRRSENTYRDRWKWDSWTWGSHAVDCYPMVGSCPYRVYVRDGRIVWEEQAGVFPGVEEGVPDFNPMGCQKGSCWHELLTAKERVLFPLKRAGERGEGKWQRISWDQALTEVADAFIDAIQEGGPEAVFSPNGANACAWGVMTQRRFSTLTGTLLADFDTDVNDFAPGMYLTWGKLTVSGEDDYAHSGVIFIWNCNPAYTRIPFFHFLIEARYKGAEVILISPDVSPSHMHCDYHLPVKVGTDAALLLGMCHTVIDEGLVDEAFVRDQTDLPLLARNDTRRFLRGSEMAEGGRDEQFYFWDTKTKQAVEAPRGTLDLGSVVPALDGTFRVTLANGDSVEVTPVFSLLRKRLLDYTPEKTSAACGVGPDVIRAVARKVASKKTHVYEGLGAGKHYHGDLMERSMFLLLALTGNWGKKGTGPTYWNSGPSTAGLLDEARRTKDPNEVPRLLAAMNMVIESIKAEDPTMSGEIANVELMKRVAAMTGLLVPPVWWWYYHAGYREIWNKREWHDPSMKREFDDYFQEALDRGWWAGVAAPFENQPPRMMIEVGDNMLRRTRGGGTMLLKHLWPKLKTIVCVDPRMSATAMYADYVLPAAQQYEHTSAMGLAHTLFFTLSDKAVEPAGEALPEWQMFRLLSRKLAERAKAREFTEYRDGRGRTYRLDTLEDAFTAEGSMVDEEQMTAADVTGSADMGTLPAGTDIATMREKGIVRFTDWGFSAYSQNYQTPLEQNETMAPFRWHVEKKHPYPTLTRRAQFYIEHEWFMEAGEELPC